MIYIDGSNITADTEPELQQFAKAYKISQSWYLPKEGRYPVFGNLRKSIMRDMATGKGITYLSKPDFAAKAKGIAMI